MKMKRIIFYTCFVPLALTLLFGCDNLAETLESELTTTYTYFADTSDSSAKGIAISYTIGEQLFYGDLPTVAREDFANLKVGYNIAGWQYWKNPLSNSTDIPSNVHTTKIESPTGKEDADGNPLTYDTVSDISVGANIAWFAVTEWLPVTYYVSFNANGGTEETPLDENPVSLVYDTTYLTFPSPEGFSLNGYNPTGWNSAANRTSPKAEHKEGDKLLNENLATKEGAVVTYYVCWEAKEINISFDAGAGAGSMATVTRKVGETLPPNEFESPSPLYQFAHWLCSARDSEYTLEDKELLTTTNYPNKDTTLTAKWGTTVTFNANGGNGTMQKQRLIYGETTQLMANAFSAPLGYTFNGWNTASDGSGISYTDEQSVTVVAGTTLYAHWTPQTYTISYNANGGTGSITAQSISFKDLPVTLTLNNGAITRDGYDFTGWKTTSGIAFADGATITSADWASLSQNTTLYAQWSIQTFVITFNANGGSPSATQTVDWGTTVSQPSDPTLAGYDFKGWYESSDGGTTLTTPFNFSTPIKDPYSLYAKWEIQTLTVTFNGNDATSGSTASLAVTYGETKTFTANGFEKTGYIFSGWNTNRYGYGMSYPDEYSISTANWMSGTLTLYAQWEARGSVTSKTGEITATDSNTGLSFTGPSGYSSYQWYVDGTAISATTRTCAVSYSDYGTGEHIIYVIAYDSDGLPAAVASAKFKVQ